jgi:hypothetical protein
MPRFLSDTRRSIIALGRCDRCHFKFYLDELSDDRNTPGLKVCARCNDQYDPYRLPAPPPDNIVLPFNRPDLPALTFGTSPSSFSGLATEDDDWIEVELYYEDGTYGIEIT